MSTPGVPKTSVWMWLRLDCGDSVLYGPPFPEEGEELTCGICGEPTEVRPSEDLDLSRR